jgi:hypothetical protein
VLKAVQDDGDAQAGRPADAHRLEAGTPQPGPATGATQPGDLPVPRAKRQGGTRRATAPEPALLKPSDIQRVARVPYETVIAWLTVGHPRAGVLPSSDLAGPGKRHSYRVRREDWEAFLIRLQTVPRERQQAKPLPRPEVTQMNGTGMFRY